MCCTVRLKKIGKAANSVFLRLLPFFRKCSAGVGERLYSTCESHSMKFVTWQNCCIALNCKAYLKDFSSNRKAGSSFLCVCLGEDFVIEAWGCVFSCL